MADITSTVPIPPAAEAIEDRVYSGPRQQPKKRPRILRPDPGEDPETLEAEDSQPQHKLDLDA
ncbi:MAG: hypothetical protein KGM47_10470 [Acidobacteriota bacterium]|nr:hypothetical protein [Acidobacteriota bacterium]